MSQELPEDLFSPFKKPGPAPWDAIWGLACQLPGNAALLDETVEEFDYLVEEPWDDMDCEFIYVCAVLAIAAAQFSPAQRSVILASLRRGMEHLDGRADLAEAALRNTLASFGEPGYVEDRPVQQWVEQFSSAFDEWVKEMDAGFTGFGPAADDDLSDAEQSDQEDDEDDGEDDGESER
jgi:hypothetical protein